MIAVYNVRSIISGLILFSGTYLLISLLTGVSWFYDLVIRTISPPYPDFTNAGYKEMVIFLTNRSLYILGLLYFMFLIDTAMGFQMVDGLFICLVGILPVIMFSIMVVCYRSFLKRLAETTMTQSRQIVEDFLNADRVLRNQLLLGEKYFFGKGSGRILRYEEIESTTVFNGAKSSDYLVVTTKRPNESINVCSVSYLFNKKEINVVRDYFEFRKNHLETTIGYSEYLEKIVRVPEGR